MLNIIVNTKFSAIHCWPSCPIEEVGYLRNPHRHEFHVQVKTEVNHTDRDIEFINLKNKINTYIRANFDQKDLGATSCETICKMLSLKFNLDYVQVLEDGENGAEYYSNK